MAQHLAWDASTYLVSLPDVFSDAECTEVLPIDSSQTWHPASLGDGRIDLEVRNHDRVIRFDQPLADKIFSSTKAHIPATQIDERGDVWHLQGVNPCMRFLRYSPGHFFKPHYDGATCLSPDLQSFLTLQLYLSTNKEGATVFLPDELCPPNAQPIVVLPKRGSVVMFEHDVLHEGQSLATENKLVLRTDILYACAASRACF